MSSTTPTYDTWHSDTAREPLMEEAHKPLWRHFIDCVPDTELSTRDVLDFGCNRGGFLRLLHALRPFRRGLGVDIAEASITAARELALRTLCRRLRVSLLAVRTDEDFVPQLVGLFRQRR